MGLNMDLTEPQTRFFTSKALNVGATAGFGAGKSEVLAITLIYNLMEHRQPILLLQPTYALLSSISYPRFSEILDQVGIPYSLNKSEGVMETPFSKIFFRTTTSVERIVGMEVSVVGLDEFDTTKREHGIKVYHKVAARARLKSKNPKYKNDTINRIYTVSTPEGYGAMYALFKNDDTKLPDSELIQMPTSSNPYLPEDYVEKLSRQYPENLLKAYLRGEFVNLESNPVYSYFSRDQHVVKQTHVQFTEDLHFGMDFNTYNTASVAIVERKNSQGETVYLVIDELVKCRDTDDMIDKIKQKYPRNTIYVYPDASGSRTQSSSMSRSDHSMLRSAGFVVRVNGTNPLIKDRVLSVNNAFDKGKLFVSEGCKNLI